MTNEEFQKLVIEKLGNLELSVEGLEQGQKNLELSVKGLEKDQKSLELSVKGLEEGQKEIRKDIGAIVEQTANLTEFKEEIQNKLDTLIEENLSIHGILGVKLP